MAQTWCARNLVLGRPEIEYLWPGMQSPIDWRIGWAFSSLTASSRLSCSNSLVIVMRTVLNSQMELSGSRTSSPSTCSSTSLASFLVVFWSTMISFSRSNVSCSDGLTLWHSWNLSRCYVFYIQAFGPNNRYSILFTQSELTLILSISFPPASSSTTLSSSSDSSEV